MKRAEEKGKMRIDNRNDDEFQKKEKRKRKKEESKGKETERAVLTGRTRRVTPALAVRRRCDRVIPSISSSLFPDGYSTRCAIMR